MSRVFGAVTIKSNKGESQIKALFDTGASRTFIRTDVATKIGDLIPLTRPRLATLGDGENKIEIKEGMFLEITLANYTLSTDADVSPKLVHGLIIGAQTMQEWGIVVDAKREEAVIKEPKTSFELVNVEYGVPTKSQDFVGHLNLKI